MPQPKKIVDKDTILIFFHIFKTAGTTMNRILGHRYDADSRYYFWGGNPEDFSKHMDLLRNASEEEKNRIKYLASAFVGIHEMVPKRCLYFTLIRNPVERVISEYRHVVSQVNHEIHDYVTENNLSLSEYVDNGMWQAWNGQVRNLTGKTKGITKYGEAGPVTVTDDDLELAKQNMKELFLVGVTERFDESLVLLKRACGWHLWQILYTRRNVAKKKPGETFHKSSIVKLIESRNQYDMMLYRYANELLDEQIKEAGILFSVDLWLFKLINNCYRLVWHIGLSTYLKIKKLLRLY